MRSFVHGDAAIDVEMLFRTQEGDVPGLHRKPLAKQWFPGKRQAGQRVRYPLSPSFFWTILRRSPDLCVQTACRMNLFTEANNRGIQTEFLDGQGHRRVTDVAALKIILDALPPQSPGRSLASRSWSGVGGRREANSGLRPAPR